MINQNLFNFAKKIFPLNRSLSGSGVRATFKNMKSIIPDLKIFSVKSGTKIFDWKVPLEWNVSDAYIITPDKNKICSFKKHNLHLVGYSHSINKKINLQSLKKKLFSIPSRPNAIPYVTSYYKKDWGFCIQHSKKKKLKEGIYTVKIDSTLHSGKINFGELFVGKKGNKKEIFFSTYVCHPSMANNEISGPVLLTFLGQWLKKFKKLKYNYRIAFVPETIGSLIYIKKRLLKNKKKIIAGYNVTCMGDGRSYSILKSKYSNSYSDKVAENVYKNFTKKIKFYDWKSRGSDERQYCSPNVNIPVTTIMRSKFNEYPEYHSSDDRLGKLVTSKSLNESFKILKNIVYTIENDLKIKSNIFGEPFLSKRNLYPTISNNNVPKKSKILLDVISYADGSNTLVDISDKIDVPFSEIFEACKLLLKQKLVRIV